MSLAAAYSGEAAKAYWRERVEAMVHKHFASSRAHVQSTVVTDAEADDEFAFAVTAVKSRASPASDWHADKITRRVASELGELARATAIESERRSFVVVIRRMPQPLVEFVCRKVNEMRKDMRPPYSLQHAARLVAVALACTVTACVVLHNHSHAYEEPWKGAAEFLQYHAALYFPSLFTFTPSRV